MADRVVLFADDANVYNGARRAFFDPRTDHYTLGNYDPCRLANLIVDRRTPALRHRELTDVRIYTGRPDPYRQPVRAAEHDKLASVRQAAGATVIARPLRYLNGKGQQKGVDVAMAIDIVTMAIDGLYDVGLVASTDTDLKPALEYIVRKCPQAHVEVLGWRSPLYQGHVPSSGVNR